MCWHYSPRVFQQCCLVGGQELLNSGRNFPRPLLRTRLVQESARPLQSTQQRSVQNITWSIFREAFPSFLCFVILGERMTAPVKNRNLQVALIAAAHHTATRGTVTKPLVMG